MATVTIRGLPDAVHRAIRLRAAQHGRSTEAEIRTILAESVEGSGRLRAGSFLRAFSKQLGGVELKVTRSRKPIEAAELE